MTAPDGELGDTTTVDRPARPGADDHAGDHPPPTTAPPTSTTPRRHRRRQSPSRSLGDRAGRAGSEAGLVAGAVAMFLALLLIAAHRACPATAGAEVVRAGLGLRRVSARTA